MRCLIPAVLILASTLLSPLKVFAQWTFVGGVVDSSRYMAGAIETHGDTVLVGGIGYGNHPAIWMSVDNGETWTPSRQLWRGGVRCFGFHKDVLLAGGRGYGFSVVRSTDGGKSWLRSDAGLRTDDLSPAVTSFLSVGNKLFAGTGNGIAVSTDDGANWQFAGTATLDTETFVSGLARAGSNIFAATSKGIFKSANDGADWIETGADVTQSTSVGDIIYHKDTLIADAYYSSDQGNTWHEIPDAIFGDNWFGNVSVFDYAAKGDTLIAWAAIYTGRYETAVLFSVDAGRTWTAHPSFDYLEMPMDIQDFDLASYGRAIAANDKFFFAAALKDRSRVVRSELGYDHWDEIGNFTATRFLASNHNDVLYTSSTGPLENIFGEVEWKSGNLYRSTDKGITWDHILKSNDAQIVHLPMGPSIQTTENEIFFVAANIGVTRMYYSSSKGDEWKTVSTPSNARVTAITNGVTSWIVSDEDMNHFRTTNQGDTWEKIDFGGFSDISRLVNTDGRLFAIACKKIITSTDGGVTWTLASESEKCLNRPESWKELGEYYMPIIIQDNYLISPGYENVSGSSASPNLGVKLYSLPADFDNPVLAGEENESLGSIAGEDRSFRTPIYTGTGFLSGNGLLFMPSSVIDNFDKRKNENWENPNWYWRWTKLDGYPSFPSEHDDMVLMDGVIYMESAGGIWSRPLEQLLSGITVPPWITTGIGDEPSRGNPLTYPNPVSDVLYVDGFQFGEGSVNLTIYDMVGAKVHTAQVELSDTNAPEVNVKLLSPGMYVIVIQANERSFSTKFMKN